MITTSYTRTLCSPAIFAKHFGALPKSAVRSTSNTPGRKYKRVVALLDEHYDELWVGGKASYKLGGIIEAGGELIIYAPHLRSISETHGKLIEKYGYAPLDRVREMVALSTELQNNLAVAAHLAHVSYAGQRDAEGTSHPTLSHHDGFGPRRRNLPARSPGIHGLSAVSA